MSLDDALRQLIGEEVERAVERALAAQPVAAPVVSDDDDIVLDARGLMEYLHIGRNAAYGLLNAAPFPVRRIGALLLCHKSAVRRWLCEEQANPAPLRLTPPHPAPSREKRVSQQLESASC